MRKYLILVIGLLLIPACARITGVKPTEIPPTQTAGVSQATSLAPGLTPTLTQPLPVPQTNPSGRPAPRFASLRMFPGETGWAVGAAPEAAELIFRTQDGGYTWVSAGPSEQQAIPPGYGAHAFFLDAEHAWVTYYPQDRSALGPSSVWHTQDGGASWAPGFTPPLNANIPDYAVEALVFTNPQNGWLMLAHSPGAGNAPVSLFNSRDAGAHWEILLDPFEGQADRLHTCCRAGMLFLDAKNGLVAYGGGPYTEPMVHITRDGGHSWRSQELPPADPQVFARAACGSGSLWQIGAMHVALLVACFDPERPEPYPLAYLYLSDDAGTSWRSLPLPEGQSEDMPQANFQRDYRLQFIDAQTGWLFIQDEDWSQGEAPVVHTSIFQTLDGGLQWTQKARVDWIGPFSFSDPLNGWAITRLGEALGLVRTRDGGGNWQSLNPTIIDD